jgi:hypothetical protein
MEMRVEALLLNLRTLNLSLCNRFCLSLRAGRASREKPQVLYSILSFLRPSQSAAFTIQMCKNCHHAANSEVRTAPNKIQIEVNCYIAV